MAAIEIVQPLAKLRKVLCNAYTLKSTICIRTSRPNIATFNAIEKDERLMLENRQTNESECLAWAYLFTIHKGMLTSQRLPI